MSTSVGRVHLAGAFGEPGSALILMIVMNPPLVGLWQT